MTSRRWVPGSALSAVVVSTQLLGTLVATYPGASASATDAAPGFRTASLRSVRVVEQEGPRFHKPEVGSCHQLPFARAVRGSDTAPPVPCSSRHNLMTVMVKRLPTPVHWKDRTWLSRRILVPCQRALIRASGGRPRKLAASSYGLFLYFPTTRERRAGAAWVRCDLGRRAGRAAIDRLPTDVRLHYRLWKAERSCLSGRVPSRLFLSNCTRPHLFGVLRLVSLTHAPRPAEARKVAAARCPRPYGRYAWTYPDRYAFRAGLRWLTCYGSDVNHTRRRATLEVTGSRTPTEHHRVPSSSVPRSGAGRRPLMPQTVRSPAIG